jgi:hypothetical protein
MPELWAHPLLHAGNGSGCGLIFRQLSFLTKPGLLEQIRFGF